MKARDVRDLAPLLLGSNRQHLALQFEHVFANCLARATGGWGAVIESWDDELPIKNPTALKTMMQAKV